MNLKDINQSVAPPLGICPRKIWEERVTAERISDLISAIERYNLAGKVVPAEWLQELRDRTGTVVSA